MDETKNQQLLKTVLDMFSIKTINCDGEFNELLVLTADEYSGTVRSSSNTCYLQVTSSNNDASQWTISR